MRCALTDFCFRLHRSSTVVCVQSLIDKEEESMFKLNTVKEIQSESSTASLLHLDLRPFMPFEIPNSLECP